MKLLVDQFLLHLKAQRNFARNTIKAYQFDLTEFNAYAAANRAVSPKDLDRLLMEETGLPVLIADDPLTCVVRGSGMALESMDKSTSIFTTE